MATQIRLSQLTGSIGTSSGQINDATTLAAGADIGAADLSTVLSHMASAIQRIHGDATFSENPAGEFSQTLTPVSDAGANLGSTSKEWGQVHANNLISQAALAVSASNANITVKGLALDVDADSTLSLDGAGGINIGTAANVAVDFNSSTFDLDASGALTLDSATSISIGTAADVAFDVDSAAFDLDASGAVTVDTSGAASHIALTSAHTAGDAILISANADAGSILNVDAGIMDVDVQGAYTLDASGVSIDSDAASNLTTSAGALTLTSAAAATWSTAAGALTIDAAAAGLVLDGHTGVDIDASNSGKVTIDGAGGIDIGVAADVAIDVDASTFDLDCSGALTADSTTALFTQSSTFGVDAVGAVTIDSDAGVTLGGAGVDIDADGSSKVTIDGAGGIDIGVAADVAIDIDSSTLDIDASGAVTIDTSAGGISLDAAAGSNFTTAAGDLDLNAAGTLDMDAGAAVELNATTSVTVDGGSSSAMSLGASMGTLDLLRSGQMTTVKGTLNVDEAATFDSNVTIAGNLDVNGTTTTIDTANMSIQDSIIALGVSGSDGGYSLTGDRGILFTRGADTAAQSGLFYNGTRYQLGVSVTGPTSSSFGSVSSYDDLLLSKVEFDSANNHVAMNGSVFTVTGNAAVEVVAGGSSDIVLDAGGDVVIDGTSQKLEFGSAGSGEHITGNGTDLTLASGGDIKLTATSDVELPTNVGLTFDSGAGGMKIEGDSSSNLTVTAGADVKITPGTGKGLVPSTDSSFDLGNPFRAGSSYIGSGGGRGADNIIANQTINTNASSNSPKALLYTVGSGGIGSAISGASSGLDQSSNLSTSTSYIGWTYGSSITLTAGQLIVAFDGTNYMPFVVLKDFDGDGSSIYVAYHSGVTITGTSLGTSTSSGLTNLYEAGSISSGGWPVSSPSSISADTVLQIYENGSSNYFALLVANTLSSSSRTPAIVYTKAATSGYSSWSSAPSNFGSSSNAGGTFDIAWRKLYVDAIDLGGQGIISVGGVGAAGQVGIDLDADGDTSIRASADDVITFEVGGSDLVDIKAAGLQITDDKKLMFGAASGGDASFEYDEDGNDVLLYAGAALRISDDVKIEFGSGGDAGIEYDEDGTDQLRIHQPAAGVVIAGTNPKLVLGDAGAEDTMMVFDGNAADFRIGLDDGTDKLEIGAGSAHGTTIALGMDASGHVTQIGQSTHTTGLYLQWDGSKAVFATVAPTIYRKTITATEIAEADGTQGYTFENADTPSGSGATSFGGSSYTYDGKIQVYLNGQLQLLGGTSDSSGIDCKPSQTTAKRIDFLSAGDLSLDDVLQVIVYA